MATFVGSPKAVGNQMKTAQNEGRDNGSYRFVAHPPAGVATSHLAFEYAYRRSKEHVVCLVGIIRRNSAGWQYVLQQRLWLTSDELKIEGDANGR